MADPTIAKMQRGHGEQPRPRIVFYDTLRGFTVISMCVFHTCYDLAYLYGLNMPWFTAPSFQDLWRDSISFTFLILAGWMTSYSRDNFKRSGIYAVTALIVWAATSVASVDTPVSFGIIYCMAACTFLWACFARVAHGSLERFPNIAIYGMGIVLLALFLITNGVQHVRYPVEELAWLGFPSVSFASGDYYPLIPYLFLYLFGAFAAIRYRRSRKHEPAWMLRNWCPPLSFIGRHSLIVYVAHQPIVLLVLQLILG